MRRARFVSLVDRRRAWDSLSEEAFCPRLARRGRKVLLDQERDLVNQKTRAWGSHRKTAAWLSCREVV